MKMLLHELHPAVIHAPLTLLPTATAADMIAVMSGSRAWAKVGRRLWVAGTVSALFSGVAGLAASQEVKLDEPRARDMVFIHGLGNTFITLGAVGVTLWRLSRPPTIGQTLIALVANAAAIYTATLGGKMVYELGVGINPMPENHTVGTLKGPPLLSREAPKALLRDGLQGMRWLISRATSLFQGKQPLVPGAKGFGEDFAIAPEPRAIQAQAELPIAPA
jgi:uncharacterized membrane protein